jgi:hypothetical protein
MKLVVIFLVLAGVAFAQGPQRNNIFFGTHMASPSGTIVYPAARSLPFGIMRVWDANTGCNGTAWEKVNTADGVFDYSCMDALVAIAATNQKELIYTFGRTPNWASSSPADGTMYLHRRQLRSPYRPDEVPNLRQQHGAALRGNYGRQGQILGMLERT